MNDEHGEATPAAEQRKPPPLPSLERARTPNRSALRLLLRRLPALTGRIPATCFGNYPSPIERLSDLEHTLALEDGTELWVKRDDVAGDLSRHFDTPVRISKVRKLELYFGDALARGAREVVTFGPLGSNHAIATAVFGRLCGLRVRLGLWPEPPTREVLAKLAVLRTLGARIERLGALDEDALTHGSTHLATHLQVRPGATTVCIPPAGTDAVGALGYVECGLEIADAIEKRAIPCPNFIHVAGGTGGVAAGLACGLALAGPPYTRIPVVCVRAVGRGVLRHARLVLLAHKLWRRLVRLHPGALGASPPGREAFVLLHEHAGRGYGAPTEEATWCLEFVHAHTNLRLDPIYTAKAFSGLLAFARSERGRGRRHLFVHTYARYP